MITIHINDIIIEEKERKPITRLIEISLLKKEPVTPYVIEYLKNCRLGYNPIYILGVMEAKYMNNNNKS